VASDALKVPILDKFAKLSPSYLVIQNATLPAADPTILVPDRTTNHVYRTHRSIAIDRNLTPITDTYTIAITIYRIGMNVWQRC
jgi:hypothetical protein